MTVSNIANATEAAKRIIHKKRGYSHESATPDKDIVIAIRDALNRINGSVQRISQICEAYELRGQLDYEALKDEAGVLFTVALVFADDVGITPTKLCLRMFSASTKH